MYKVYFHVEVHKKGESPPAKTPLPPMTIRGGCHHNGAPHGYTAIILKNSIFCKLLEEKNTGKAIFLECQSSLRPEVEKCPCCRAKGTLHIHSYYGRSLHDCVEKNVSFCNLCVPRLICDGCGHTHAVLCDPIIPYARHSLFFILWALAFQLVLRMTVEETSEYMGISTRTFYRWKRLYKEHETEWMGRLRAQEISIRKILVRLLCRHDPFAKFAASYRKMSGRVFLQSHKNPSHSCRKQKTSANSFPPPHNMSLYPP